MNIGCLWMAGQECAGQPAGALPLWCEDLTRIVQWKQVTQYDTCMTHIYASSSRSEYDIYDIISNAFKPELQKKSYWKCDPLHVLDEVERITHWCSWDCPQPATSLRRTLSFLRSVRDIVCRSSALWQEMALGEWGRQALDVPPKLMPSKWQKKFLWTVETSMSISQQMILFWKLVQFTQRRPDLQKWLHFWSPKDNVNLATWAKWSSKQKQQVLWRGLKKEIESVRLSRTWQACQPDTPFNGHMSRLIFRFSLGIAGPFKIGDCSFVFWWCKKLDTEKSSRSAAQHGFWVKPQDSMPVGQMELVGPPGTVWACDFGVGEAAQWLFLVSFVERSFTKWGDSNTLLPFGGAGIWVNGSGTCVASDMKCWFDCLHQGHVLWISSVAYSMPHNWESPVVQFVVQLGGEISASFRNHCSYWVRICHPKPFFWNVKYVTLCIILHFLKFHKV